jgi:hypothetical protein
MRVLLILFLTMFLFSVEAQVDSVRLDKAKFKADSLLQLSNGHWLMDSLKIEQWSANIREKVNTQTLADSLGLKSKIDSLKKTDTGINIRPFEQKLDSVLAKKDHFIQEINSKQDALLKGSREKVQRWQSKIKGKWGIDSLEANTNINISQNLNLPNAKAISGNLKLPELPQMPQLSNEDFKAMNFSPELVKFDKPSFDNPLNGLRSIEQSAGSIGRVVNEAGTVMKNSDKALQSTVMKLDNMKEVEDQLKSVEGFKENDFLSTAKKLEDPEAMKKELASKVQEEAINHFAGKQQELNVVMESMGKYKKKFANVDNLDDLAKKLKIKNRMNDKPLIERIVPGFALQIQRKGDLLIDFNPYIGYRISGIFTGGFGWNHRFNLDKYYHYAPINKTFGPRLYGEVKLLKGFFPRVEAELMNTDVPPALATSETNREWVSSVMVGIKKEYKFLKKIRGTAIILFNLYNSRHKSPYQDDINFRFGFEFPMKKKQI